MNENNIAVFLRDVIRLACHADLSSYEQVKRQALLDIYDAIASSLNVDHHALEAQNAISTDACHSGMEKYLQISDNLKLFRFRGSEFTKLIGRTAAHDGQPPRCYEIKVFRLKPNGGQAEAYVDGNIIFSVVSPSNIHMIEKMAVSALKRWCKEHRRRGEMRKKDRNVPTVG